MTLRSHLVVVLVGSSLLLPSTALAASIALEAPLGAPSRNPGESYSVI